MEAEQLERITSVTNKLFDDIDARINKLHSRVKIISNRVESLRATLSIVTVDKNKPLRFYSPSTFPVSEVDDFKSEPIKFERIRFPNLNPEILRKVVPQYLPEVIDQAGSMTKKYINHVDKLLRSVQTESLATCDLDLLDSTTSICSLLVFHSYENRLSRARDKSLLTSRRNLSQGGNSSVRDYGFTGTRTSKKSNIFSLTSVDVSSKKQSTSNEELAANYLGPAPDSILQYHQETALEPDMFDVGLYDSKEEDESIFQDLPDILPTLKGIVADVNLTTKKSRDYNTPRELNGTSERSIGLEKDPDLETQSTNLIEVDSTQPPVATGVPPPPPPPLPAVPLHSVPSLKKQSEDVLKETKPINNITTIAPPPPLPPSPPLPVSSAYPSVASPVGEVKLPIEAPSGRDALMAEIRLAASRPKKVNARRGTGSEESARPTANTAISSLNPRDSLLASIREAAGKPKAKTSGRKPSKYRLENETPKKESDTGFGGDNLMSDLVNKLKARRDGINGSFGEDARSPPQNVIAPKGAREPQQTLDKSSDNILASDDTPIQRVMNQVSAMIPSRTSLLQTGARDRSDSEDYDDDDWN